MLEKINFLKRIIREIYDKIPFFTGIFFICVSDYQRAITFILLSIYLVLLQKFYNCD